VAPRKKLPTKLVVVVDPSGVFLQFCQDSSKSRLTLEFRGGQRRAAQKDMTNCLASPDAGDAGAPFCPCFVDTTSPGTSTRTVYNSNKRAGPAGTSTDATIQSCDASLIDEDDGHIDPHYSPPAGSSRINIEKTPPHDHADDDDDDDEFAADGFGDISEVSYGGQNQDEPDDDDGDEDALVSGLEDAYQHVMTGNDTAATKDGKNKNLGVMHSNSKKSGSKKRLLKKRVASLRRSAGGSRLVRSLSFSSSKHDGGDDGTTANKEGSYDAANISAEIDAILGIERTRTAGRGQELLIKYVKSDNEDVEGNEGNNIQSAASFTQSGASQFVPAAAAAAAAAGACAAATNGTCRSSSPNVPTMRSHSLMPSYDDDEVGEGEQDNYKVSDEPSYSSSDVDDTLDEGVEVDDLLAMSTGKDPKKKSRSAAVTARLRRSIGSFKRTGSKLARRVSISSTTSSAYHQHCNDDVAQTLGLVGSTPDTTLFAEEVCSDDSSSDGWDSDLSSKGLRRRVVKVESRVQSQIERAMSFDSQHSLALPSSSQQGRGQRPEQKQQHKLPQQPPPPQQQQQHSVLLSLGCIGSGVCAELETPNGVKKYAGMPLFNDGGTYVHNCSAILPSRSVNENTVAFVDAPPTDPVTSGLVASPSYDSEEESDGDSLCGGSSDEQEHRTRKSKGRRRPLAFLRKKTTGSNTTVG